MRHKGFDKRSGRHFRKGGTEGDSVGVFTNQEEETVADQRFRIMDAGELKDLRVGL